MAKKANIGAGIALDGEKEFRQAISNINSDMKVLGSELKKVSSEFLDNKGSIEALTAKDEVLNKQLDAQKDKVEAVRKALENSKDQYGENDKKTKDWQITLNNAEADLNKLNKEIDDNKTAMEQAKNPVEELSDGIEAIGDSAEDAGSKTLGFADVLKANLLSSAILEGINLIKNGLKNLANDTLGFVNDSNTAFNNLTAKTGASSEEFDSLKKAMDNVYASNFGDDIGDVADSMAEVKQQTDLSGDALENMTKQALLMRDTFDMDVSESVRAANMLMEQFGLTSEEAYSMIAQGAQNGLNKNGDLLDVINEYSGQFNILGLSAEDMFNMLANGADSGTFSVDKLGDAVKEFGIRVKDGTADDAFKQLGLNVNETTSAFGEGGEAAKTAMQSVVEALFSVKDPIEQNTLGVSMFGTMWEDLGASGIEALTNLNGSISTTSTALEDINNKKYSNIGSALDGLGRQVQTSIAEPLSDKIMPIVQKITEYIQENSGDISQKVGEIAEKVGDFVSWIVDNKDTVIAGIAGMGAGFVAWNVVTTIQGVVGAIKAFQLANEGATIAQYALNLAMNANPIGIVITAVTALIAIVGTLWATNEDFREGVKDIWNGITETISGAVEKVKDFFNGVIAFVRDNWQALLLMLVNPISGAFKLIYDNNEEFRTKVNELVEKVKTFFVDLGKSIGELPGKLKEHFDNGVQKIQEFANSLKDKSVEAAKNVLTHIVNGLNDLPDNLKTIGINAVKGIWNGISGLGTWIVKNVKEFGGDIISGFTSGLTGLADIGLNLVKGIWNGISNATDWIIGKIGGFTDSVVGAIKSFFGIHSPSTVFRDEVGKYLAQGLGEGFVDEMESITKDINDSIPTDFNIEGSVSMSRYSSGSNAEISSVSGAIDYDRLTNAFMAALNIFKPQVILDRNKIGEFIIDTINREVIA